MADELTIAMRLRGARAVNAQLDETAASVSRVNRAAARGVAPLTRFGKSMDRTGTMLTRRLSLPLLVAGGFAVKMSLDFDKSLRKIIGLVGISSKTVMGWKDDMRSLSRDTGVDLDQIAEGMFFVTSAGFRGAAAMRVLRASALASAAGLGDVHTVADAVTSAVNAYGESVLSASHATDALVAGVRLGKMPVDALAGAVGQVLPVASAVGVSFQELVAISAGVSRIGGNVNRTMTGMRFLLTALVKPSSQAAKVLKSVGISGTQLMDSIKKRGLLATLQDLRSRLSLPDFLKVTGGARGLGIALNSTGRNAGTFNDIFKQTMDSTGATGKAFDAISKGPGFKLHKAINNLKVSLEEFGDTLTPLVIKLAGAISFLARGFGHMGTAGTILIAGLVLLGPALKAAALGTRVLAASRMLATEATFAATAAETSFTAALLASPITWIVLGLAAIAVGFYLLFTRVKAFHNAVVAVFNWIKSHWRLLAIILGGPVGLELVLLVNHFKTLKRWAQAVFHWVMKIVRGIKQIKFPHVPGSGIIGKVGGVASGAEKFLGGLATGGPVRQSGSYVVGEHGPEIVTLPAGGHVTPNGGDFALRGEVPVQLMLDGKVLAEATARVVADRKARR